MWRGDARVATVLFVLALVLALAAAVSLAARSARRPRSGGWVLPVSFAVTGQGTLYLAAVLLLSFAAINSGNNLLFLVLASMLSAIIVSGIVARMSLRSVSVALQVPENVFEGERISIKVSLRNGKRFLPSFSISVEDTASAGMGRSRRVGRLRRADPWPGDKTADRAVLHHPAYFPIIPAGEMRTELVFQSFPRRGPYRLTGFRLSTRFPFGFFRRGERVRSQGEVLVYPSIQEISSYFNLLPFLPGHLEGSNLGPGENLYAIRKYREGESARLLDWKATAKTGELMAREYAREEESKICIILDTSIHSPAQAGRAAQFERAVSLAASLAAHFCGQGAELEFLTPGEYVPRGNGVAHLYRVLRSLALVTCTPAVADARTDLSAELSGAVEKPVLQEILSDKVFKIIITSRPRNSLTSAIRRSSHVIHFDEL